MFDLTKLIDFNPALVYSFEPESAPNREDGINDVDNGLLPVVGQFEDTLEAYLFAQNDILPRLKKMGKEAITEELLLDWVKSIHRIIAKTLLGMYNVPSGEFTKRYVARWHKGSDLFTLFSMYLSKLIPLNKEQFINELIKEKGFEGAELVAFLNLLDKIANNSEYTIDPTQAKDINYQSKAIEGIIILNKLITAYHANKLNPAEKKTVELIFKCCPPPHKLPNLMNKWAHDTLTAYRKCDPTKIDDVCEFLANTFYTLTEIHPFANDNGRTATCFINILLRSWGYPSILLRYPGDKSNDSSIYAKAIASIDSSREPLTRLIHARILEAQKTEFSDPKLKRIIEYRVELGHAFAQMKREFPRVDVNKVHTELVNQQKIQDIITKSSSDEELKILLLATELSLVYEKLNELKKQKSPGFSLGTLSADNVEFLRNKLYNVTGLHGWKVNNANGIIAWLELPNEKNPDHIKYRVEALSFAKHVVIARRKDNGVLVLKCEEVNPYKLMEQAHLMEKYQTVTP
jgi:prophage maintenance system killer protein